MTTYSPPQLWTTGKIARELGVAEYRVIYVLRTRKYIQPTAIAGILRLYDNEAVAQIRQALSGIDARRDRKVDVTDSSAGRGRPGSLSGRPPA